MRTEMKRKLHMRKTEKLLIMLGTFFLCLFSMVGTLTAAPAYIPVDATIPFSCQAVPGGESLYEIKIRSKTETSPAPEQDVIRIDREGNGSFQIRITEPGNYDYLVYELQGSDSNIVYDDTMYDVHVFVTNNDRQELEYYVTTNYTDTDEKPKKVVFQNAVQSESVTTEEATTEHETVKPPSDVQTGDDTRLGLIIMICAIAGAGVVVLMIRMIIVHRKEKK